MPLFSGAEVAKHRSRESCWIVIHSKVYDVTSFVNEHPGGAVTILKQGGADATEEFDSAHSENILDMLPDGSYIGDLDANTADQLGPSKVALSKPPSSRQSQVPYLPLCVTANDFETPAKAVLAKKAWIYVSSSANSGLSMKANIEDWSRINFRPRVLVGVPEVDTRRSILGHVAQLPFFIPPMGTMGAAHPGAEPLMVRGAVRKGLHMTLSTASTKPAEEVMSCYEEEQARLGGRSPSRLFFQLYISTDHSRTKALLQKVKKAGFKGLWWTVDAAVIGKRLADRRLQAEEALAAGCQEDAWTSNKENPSAPASGGRPAPGFLDPGISWEYLEWIRREWDGPIVIKGIQTAADARLAVEHGCDGIVLSNHGGRQMHTAPSSLMTLLEIRAHCPEILGKVEIYLDGGLRDGSDILKAICLGATAVGVGRPFLYALAAYGAAGVERCTDSEFDLVRQIVLDTPQADTSAVLAEELTIAMRLLGIASLDQARPDMVNATRLLNEMWRPESSWMRSHL